MNIEQRKAAAHEWIREMCGKEYADALIKVIEIRSQRRLQYKDEYLTDPPEFLEMQVVNKIKRAAVNRNNPNTDYEGIIDNAADAANYSIFIVAQNLSNEE